jgi:prepilin peptidase CpaA
MSAAEAIVVTTVCVACFYDVTTSRIPNVLTFMAAGLGLLFHAFAPAGSGWSHTLLGLLAGLLVFFPLFALRAMGGGDVKLMAAIGSWIGATSILNVALYGSVAGGLLAVIVAVRRRYLKKAITNVKMLLMFWWVEGVKPFPALTLESSEGLRLPYAVAIAAGLAVTLWQR